MVGLGGGLFGLGWAAWGAGRGRLGLAGPGGLARWRPLCLGSSVRAAVVGWLAGVGPLLLWALLFVCVHPSMIMAHVQ